MAFLRMLEGVAARQAADLAGRGLADAAVANARVRDEVRARLHGPE